MPDPSPYVPGYRHDPFVSYYARDPGAFAEAMERDLATSLLFVQILGPYTSPPIPDPPKGYEGLQLDLAERHRLPILRWHDPALDLGKIGNRELFDRAEITPCDFEDFQRYLQALKGLAAQ